jgi:hypothetical protein
MTHEQNALNSFLESTEVDPELAKLRQQVKDLEKQLDHAPSFDDFPTMREQINTMHAPLTDEHYRLEKSIVALCPGCNSQIMASVCPVPPPEKDQDSWTDGHIDTLLEVGRCVLSGYQLEIIDRDKVDMKGCTCGEVIK